MLSRVATSPAGLGRRLLAGFLACTLALQTACYSYAPLQTTSPTRPREIGVVLNDRGRFLLGERVGALTDRIDGRIISLDSATVRLSVARVTDLRGGVTTWTGEDVSVPRDGILGFRERKISKFKTLLLIGAAALVAVATLSLSLDLFGDGRPDAPVEGPPQGT